jgi:tryptophan synthase beta chain
VSDRDALRAFHELAGKEGILPALESAHAVAYALLLTAELPKDAVILVNLSGRGDKDLATVVEARA